MASTSAWRSAALAAAAVLLGCTEQIAAPGQCPALCPDADVELVDTTLSGVVVGDTSIRGFVAPHEAAILVASNLDSLRSLVLIRLPALDTAFTQSGDTTRIRIGGFDSVVVEATVLQRDTAAKDLRVLIVRLPAGIDTTTTYAGALPYFDDSLIVDSIVVADSLRTGTLRASVPPARMLPDSADSNRVALGLAVRARVPTAVTFGAADFSGVPPRVTYYARGEAPQDTLRATLARSPAFDTFVMTPVPGAPPAGAMVVGNLPSARSVLRFDVPQRLLDSTTVVRGTLVLTLLSPATGRPNETFDLEARAVIRDFDGKSVAFADTALLGHGQVTVGQTGTVEVEIGRILRLWGTPAADTLPRAIVLRNRVEGSALGEVTVARFDAGAAAPVLRLTFVRPYAFGVP